MKIMNSTLDYDVHASYNYKGHKYSIYQTAIDESITSDEAFKNYAAQITKISPYDDADYYWAKIERGKIRIIRNGKTLFTSYYLSPEDSDEESISEWADDIIDYACDHLVRLNNNVEPRMIHM